MDYQALQKALKEMGVLPQGGKKAKADVLKEKLKEFLSNTNSSSNNNSSGSVAEKVDATNNTSNNNQRKSRSKTALTASSVAVSQETIDTNNKRSLRSAGKVVTTNEANKISTSSRSRRSKVDNTSTTTTSNSNRVVASITSQSNAASSRRNKSVTNSKEPKVSTSKKSNKKVTIPKIKEQPKEVVASPQPSEKQQSQPQELVQEIIKDNEEEHVMDEDEDEQTIDNEEDVSIFNFSQVDKSAEMEDGVVTGNEGDQEDNQDDDDEDDDDDDDDDVDDDNDSDDDEDEDEDEDEDDYDNDEDMDEASEFLSAVVKINEDELIDLISDSEDDKMEIVSSAIAPSTVAPSAVVPTAFVPVPIAPPAIAPSVTSNVDESKRDAEAKKSSDSSHDGVVYANEILKKLMADRRTSLSFADKCVLKEVYHLIHAPVDVSTEFSASLTVFANECLMKLMTNKGALMATEASAINDIYQLMYNPSTNAVQLTSNTPLVPRAPPSISWMPPSREVDDISVFPNARLSYGGGWNSRESFLPSPGPSGFKDTPMWPSFTNPARNISTVARSISSLQSSGPLTEQIDSRKRMSDYVRVDDEVTGSSVKRRPLSDIHYSSGLSSLGSGTIGTFHPEQAVSPRLIPGSFLSVKKESSTKENVARFSDILVQPSSDLSSRRQSLGSSFLERKRLQRKSSSGEQATVAKIILETLSDLTSPMDDLRRKPVSLSIPVVSTNRNSIGGALSVPNSQQKQEPSLGQHVRFEKEEPKPSSSSSSTYTSSNTMPLAETVIPPKKQNEPFIAKPAPTTDSEFIFDAPLTVQGIDYIDTTSQNTSDIKYVFSPPGKNPVVKAAQQAQATKASDKPQPTTISASSSSTASQKAPPVVNKKVEEKAKKPEESPFVDLWAMAAKNTNGTKCQVCLVPNPAGAKKCVSCESPLTDDKTSSTPLVASKTSAPPISSSSSAFKFGETPASSNSTGGFTFGGSAPAPAPAPAPAASGGFTFGSSAPAAAPASSSSSSSSGGFTFGGSTPATDATKNTVTFGSSSSAKPADKVNNPSTSAPFQFGSSNTAIPSAPATTDLPKSTTSFSFGGNSNDDKGAKGSFIFGASNTPAVKPNEPEVKEPSKMFGSTTVPSSTPLFGLKTNDAPMFGGLKNDGAPSGTKSDSAAATFSFGSTKSDSAPAISFGSTKSDSAAAAISFDSNKNDKTNDSKTFGTSIGSLGATPFSFGGSKESEKKPATTSAFPSSSLGTAVPSFGTTSNTSTSNTAPTNTFGSSATSTFSFGSVPSASTAEKTKAAAPIAATPFGSSALSSTTTAPTTTGPFGSSSASTPFMFGASTLTTTSTSTTTSSSSAATSTGPFGGLPVAPPSSSPFVFGASAPSTSQTTASTTLPTGAPFAFGGGASLSGAAITTPRSQSIGSQGVDSPGSTGMDIGGGYNSGDASNLSAPTMSTTTAGISFPSSVSMSGPFGNSAPSMPFGGLSSSTSTSTFGALPGSSAPVTSGPFGGPMSSGLGSNMGLMGASAPLGQPPSLTPSTTFGFGSSSLAPAPIATGMFGATPAIGGTPLFGSAQAGGSFNMGAASNQANRRKLVVKQKGRK